MKGINSAVSISLVLMLTALSTALAGYEVMSVQHSTQKVIKNIASTEAKKAQENVYTCIHIESIHESTIYLRNCGNSIINTSKLTVYIDGIPQKIDTNYSTKLIYPSLIYPSKLGKIYIKNHFIGNHEVKVDYMQYAEDSITHNFGYAYLVEGNSHMQTSGDLNITPTQSFTFMAWVYFDDKSLLDFANPYLSPWFSQNCIFIYPLFNRYPNVVDFNGYLVGENDYRYGWFAYYDAGGLDAYSYIFIDYKHQYNINQRFWFPGTWDYMVVTYNTSSYKLKLYLNSKKIAEIGDVYYHPYLNHIYFGSCDSVAIHTFDDIRIYKTALNQTQIIKCMYGDNCPTKGLIAYYNFNNCELKNMANPSKFWLTGKNIICVNTES